MVGVVLAVTIFGACGGKDEPLGPIGSVPQATTTTNPYAVPAMIDEAYVNRVLAGLERALGDVTRLIVGSLNLPPEAIDRLKVLYLDDGLLQLVVDGFQKDLLRGLEGIRPNPGDRRTTVIELLSVTPGCLFARVRTDASAVVTTPNATYEQWIGLVPLDASPPTTFNATNWGFVYEGANPDRSAPEDPCDDS